MKTIRCFAGVLQQELLPRLRLMESLKPAIEAAFAAGSTPPDLTPGLTPAIRLEVDTTRIGSHTVPVLEVDLADLQLGLARLIDQTPESSLGTDWIGLIYASSFSGYPRMLGLMFDDPLAGAYSAAEEFSKHPRQGCAVFVDAIANLPGRPADSEDFHRELLFTSVHELGHVFNLWHLASPPSFMASSPPDHPHPPEYFGFVDAPNPPLAAQRRFLAACPQARSVHPGGKPFGDRTPEGPDGADPDLRSVAARGHRRLELRLRMAETDFWPFEPVELDLSVRLPAGSPPASVPDTLHPGYETLRIWIEDRQGRRRTYRPPVRFCQNLGRLRIVPGAPHDLDVSLFFESGGLTFSQPGEYRVSAEWTLSRSVRLRSNTIRLHIRPPAPRDPVYRALRRLARSPRRIRSLHYRPPGLPPTEIEAFAQIADAASGRETAGLLRYTIARSTLRRAERTSPAHARRFRAEARTWFERAGEALDPRSHRSRRAAGFLNALG